MKCDILLVQDQRKYEDELKFITLKTVFTFIISLLNLGSAWATFNVLPELKKKLTEMQFAVMSPKNLDINQAHNCDL